MNKVQKFVLIRFTMAITSKNSLNYKMVNKNYFVSIILAMILFSGILSIAYHNADATSKDIKKKAKKIVNKMEDAADCMKYNSFMSQKAMKEGKTFYANPDCDEDEQWKYDRLNSGELSNAEMESILKSEAYNNKDNDEKYRDLDDSNLDYSDDDDDNKITKNAKDVARDIGDKLKNLAK